MFSMLLTWPYFLYSNPLPPFTLPRNSLLGANSLLSLLVTHYSSDLVSSEMVLKLLHFSINCRSFITKDDSLVIVMCTTENHYLESFLF